MPALMVPMLVGMFVMMQMFGADPSYSASAQLTVTRIPQQIDIDDFRYNEYYLFLSSEFFIDDLVEIVRGNVFAEDVHQRIQDDFGIDIPAGAVQAAMSSDRQHRILTLDVTSDDPDRTIMIAQAASSVLNESAGRYFGFETEERDAVVQPIQVPESAASTTTTDQIFWMLQIALALFAGVLLAYLIDYLDDRLYTAETVEHSLDMDVLAEIPPGKVT